MGKRPRAEHLAGKMMAKRPRVGQWDDHDILSLIFGVLHSYADHAHASAVCRDWYAVGVQSSPPTPMLRVPPTAAAFVAEYVWVSPICCVWRPAASQQPPPLPAPTPSSTASLIPARSQQPPSTASLIPASSQQPPSTASLIPACSLQRPSIASLTPPIPTIFQKPPPLPFPTPNPTASPPSPTPPSTVPLPFLRPFGQGMHNLNGFPEEARTARFCGSFPGGWAALALDRWRGPSLHNIITGDRVDLPDVIRCPAPAVDCPVAVKCLVLSAAPTPDGSYVIAAMISGVSNIAFWRPGMDRWWPPTPVANNGLWRNMLLRDPVVDLIYFRGRLHHGFYVLNSKEQLAAYVEDDQSDDGDDGDDDGDDEDGDDEEDNHPTMRVMTYKFESGTPCNSERVSARYLVESEGELVMVRHLRSPEDFEFFALEERSVEAGDTVVAWWRKCPVLGGQALFLGRGCSRSLESGNPSSVVVHSPCSSEDTDWLYL